MEQQLNAQFRYNTITMRPLMDANTVSEAIEKFGKIIGIKLVPESEAEHWKQMFQKQEEDFIKLRNEEYETFQKYDKLRNSVQTIKDILI